MNADELFKMSKHKAARGSDGSTIHKSGLSMRVIRPLCLAGYARLIKGETPGTKDYEFDWDKIEAHVKSGEIWAVNMLGEKRIRMICEVLAERNKGGVTAAPM